MTKMIILLNLMFSGVVWSGMASIALLQKCHGTCNTTLACQVKVPKELGMAYTLEWTSNGVVLENLTIFDSGFKFLNISSCGSYNCTLKTNEGIILDWKMKEVGKDVKCFLQVSDRVIYLEGLLGGSATSKVDISHNNQTTQMHFQVIDDQNGLVNGFVFTRTNKSTIPGDKNNKEFQCRNELKITKDNVTEDDGESSNLIIHDGVTYIENLLRLRVLFKPSLHITKGNTAEKYLCIIRKLGTNEEKSVRKQVVIEFIESENNITTTVDDWIINEAEGSTRTNDQITVMIPLVANNSGELICRAENKYGPEKGEYKVCVSDESVDISRTSEPKTLLEGDRAVLTCRISTCFFNKSHGIVWSHVKGDMVTQINDTSTVIGKKNSITSILNMTSIKSGVYFCSGVKIPPCEKCDEKRKFKVDSASPYSYFHLVVGLGCAIITSVAIAGGIFLLQFLKRRHTMRRRNVAALQTLLKNQSNMNDNIPLNEQGLSLPFDIKWGFPSEKLRLGKHLGSGNYGLVTSAIAYGLIPGIKKTAVAVKMAKCFDDQQTVSQMVAELKIMANLGRNTHIVNLLGAVIDKLAQEQLMIIVELCPYGNLNSYLIENRYRFVNQLNANAKAVLVGNKHKGNPNEHAMLPLNTSVIVSWSFQIAKGMQWLSSKRVVHGDLAARNILLTHGNIVKISDFGLSKNLYNDYVKEHEKDNVGLPVMWMAIEAVRDGKFSTKSDVWSYGITLWEMFSLGAMPYTDFESFRELWRNLLQGYRLQKPSYAPQSVFDIVLTCWDAEPENRPCFKTLFENLYQLMGEDARNDYLAEVETLNQIHERAKSDDFGHKNPAYTDLSVYHDVAAERREFPRPYSCIQTLEIKNLS